MSTPTKIAKTTFTIALMVAISAGIRPYQARTDGGSNNTTKAPSRAFFVFGDSLVDSGNNNFLATTARADSPPYGIDFPGNRPTGRFSNGLNFPDILAEAIGMEHPRAYMDPQLTQEQLLNGANFASAGVGILDDTGFQFVNIIKIYQQLELFKEYQVKVRNIIGEDQTNQLLDRAIILITLGGNDFVNNYFLLPFSARKRQYSLPDFCVILITEYKKVLLKLYGLGARRVLVTGTGPLGCVPAELAMYMSPDGGCAKEPQQAAAIFNRLLSQMIEVLNEYLGSPTFIFANAFDTNMGMINDPHKFGFASSKLACCGQGIYNGLGLCTPLSNLCPDREAFVFWDPFHPTEKAVRLLVNQMMTGSTDHIRPMNLTTIMALDFY